jgi:hypothetical protein
METGDPATGVLQRQHGKAARNSQIRPQSSNATTTEAALRQDIRLIAELESRMAGR